MKMFEPNLWKINSKNNLKQNLLHFFITSRFKSSLVYLLRHPNQHVQDMVFERDMANKTPLRVSLRSLSKDPVIVGIWDVMKKLSLKKIQQHFETYDRDILHVCAETGQKELLLQIARVIERSESILRQNKEDRTVLDLCNDQNIVCQLLELLSTQIQLEDALKDIKDRNKQKNLLHHWAAKNFDDAVNYFRKSVSPSVFTGMLFEKSANGSTPLMVSATNGSKECLQIFLCFLSLEMKDWTPDLNKTRMDIILHHKNNYNQTLLSLVLKQNEILEVSKHILLEWEKITHKEVGKGRNADQKQRKAVTRCMKANLKPSIEVQKALADVNDSLRKKKTKILFIWTKVFLKTLFLPIVLLLLDAFPDIWLVNSYRDDWLRDNSTSHYQDFEACQNGNLSSSIGNLSTSMPFVCFPVKLGKKPKFFYALVFIISPWFFYLFEYFHSDHCVNFQKVSISFHSNKKHQHHKD